MPWVWVSIGSNIERERNVRGAIAALRADFGELVISPVYENPAEGFDGDPFYNLVAGFDTELPPRRLHQRFREIEHLHGRTRGDDRFAPRSLDIDLLTYGDLVSHEEGIELPRDEIERYAFVLGPLADVAPDQCHPVTGRCYLEMWNSWPPAKRRQLQRVDIAL